MAKATTKKAILTVGELAAKHGIEGRTLRAALRTAGIKPKETGETGFGPKAKYEFEEGSKEMKVVEKLIAEIKAKPAKTPKADKKADEKADKKAPAADDDDDDDEE